MAFGERLPPLSGQTSRAKRFKQRTIIERMSVAQVPDVVRAATA
ncbi:hypothetical protein MEA186_30622 [Mesorhizobium amorphae CCNWGS0123]|uniref:Uncharacterized protein n=1 Tax=Mesorhizobium amorphae CCNWGS0123 TaxID=1082933 RepID=G6YJE7_9HYPH|nr:hypothetical protein MEA186_30622 [Mesorhizobium amorphae CCNWGS0123]